MPEARKLKPIGSAFCKQYNSEARFYIDEAHQSGQRHLIVQYGEGYSGRDDLPTVDGRPQFAAAIPDEWSEQDLQDLILWPMKSPNAPYPAWEVAARAHGSPTLFRWWAGEEGT
jgi:hypothetical protein